MAWMHIIRNNKMAKILALLGAILMWFFVVREQNPMTEVSYTIAVQQQNLNPQSVVEGVPKQVRITLRGPRDTMVTLRPEFLKANLDLSGVTPGSNNVKVTFTPPAGVTVVDMKPGDITVVVDEYFEKDMPVEINPKGKLPSDVALKSLKIVPNQVKVSGPKELVDSVAHVFLKVDLDNQAKNFTAQGKLVAVDNQGQVVDVTLTPGQAQAQYELDRIRTEKAISLNATTKGSPASGYVIRSITVKPTQITVTGKEDALKDLTSLSLEPIDVSGASSNVEGAYNLDVPDGITTEIHTVNVSVEIVKQ